MEAEALAAAMISHCPRSQKTGVPVRQSVASTRKRRRGSWNRASSRGSISLKSCNRKSRRIRLLLLRRAVAPIYCLSCRWPRLARADRPICPLT